MKDPLISIIMPNYNHAHFLSDALNGIINQSFREYEFIIIDDASTDNSIEVINNYINRIPNAKLIRHSKNQGVFSSFNYGLKYARGEYVAFLAADDKLYPNFLEKTAEFVLKNKNIALCCTDANYKNQNNLVSRKTKIKESIVFTPFSLRKALKATKFRILSQVAIYKKNIILKNGGFSENLKCMSDWYLNYKIGFQYDIGYIPEILGEIRILKDSFAHSMALNKSNSKIILSNLIKLLENEHSIIRKHFIESTILTDLDFGIIKHLITRPHYFSYLKPLLRKLPYLTLRKIYHKFK